MPNGFHGSEEQWTHITAPLRDVDAAIADFARLKQLVLTRDYHNWPSRLLHWPSEIERQIEVSLETPENRHFRVSATAWIDERGARYWRNEVIKESIPADELGSLLPHLLELAYERARSWGRSDLAFATKLSED